MKIKGCTDATVSGYAWLLNDEKENIPVQRNCILQGYYKRPPALQRLDLLDLIPLNIAPNSIILSVTCKSYIHIFFRI